MDILDPVWTSTKKLRIVHDFTWPGYEHGSEFGDFYAWFRQAIEDFIEFR